jgi:sulfur carrier protein ThiS
MSFSEMIHINKMDGVGTITLDINSGSSIMDIKMALHDKIGIPPKKIVLAFNGEILQSDTLLTEVRDSYPDNPLAEENKLTLLNYTKGGGSIRNERLKKERRKVAENLRKENLRKENQDGNINHLKLNYITSL